MNFNPRLCLAIVEAMLIALAALGATEWRSLVSAVDWVPSSKKPLNTAPRQIAVRLERNNFFQLKGRKSLEGQPGAGNSRLNARRLEYLDALPLIACVKVSVEIGAGTQAANEDDPLTTPRFRLRVFANGLFGRDVLRLDLLSPAPFPSSPS